MLERCFQLAQHRTTVRTEVTAGLTTFAAMAYILAVNPAILSKSGMDAGAVVTATALASALMTAVMGWVTNYPIALAPGMGMNAFFALTICVGMGIPWRSALGLVFVSGCVFLALTVSGVRQRIIGAIPAELKTAISCGIGLFIAFIGLQKAGVVTGSPATLVTAGKLGAPSTLLALAGVMLTAVLVWWRVRGAIILGVLAVAAAGLLVPAGEEGGRLTRLPSALAAWPASLAPTFLQLDVGYVFTHWREALPLVLALLFVDLFDNMGTLIGVCQRAGLLDEQGQLPKIGRALAADAGAAMLGSCLGTSTVTSYIESAAGVEEGGRTGLTSLVVAVGFLGALFLHPVILAIPAVATAPALVMVGIFMMQGVLRLDLADLAKAVPAVLTMMLMPLTFSISEGIAVGFVAHVAIRVGVGRWREVSWISWILAGLFLAHFLSR